MDSSEEYLSSFSTDTSIGGLDTSEESMVRDDNDSLFESLKAADIVKLMNQYIDDVKSVDELSWFYFTYQRSEMCDQLPTTAIRIFLSHTKWDKHELLDRLFNGNLDEFFAKANVADPSKRTPLVRGEEEITCDICFVEIPQVEIVGLGCGHEYCKDCWREYLKTKILDDGHSESICCPTDKCGIIVDDVTIMNLVSDENVRQKYQHLMTNSFVEHNKSLRWCPSPGCELAIQVNRLFDYRQNCTCICGHRFCFNCGAESHDPIPCKVMINWLKNDTDANIKYITKHTKGCPKCNSPIEKNGGCNLMMCNKCKHGFCWLCLGNWASHAIEHHCSPYKSTDDTEDDRERWSHYFQFYALHMDSLKHEKELMVNGDLKEKMDQLHGKGATWFEAQFLMKAVEILCESRKQLMLTCIFAYSLAPASDEARNQQKMFEDNQNDLQSATEALSQYLEQNITTDNAQEIMLKVKNKATYCERRQNALKEHIYEGFEHDWWSFTSH